MSIGYSRKRFNVALCAMLCIGATHASAGSDMPIGDFSYMASYQCQNKFNEKLYTPHKIVSLSKVGDGYHVSFNSSLLKGYDDLAKSQLREFDVKQFVPINKGDLAGFALVLSDETMTLNELIESYSAKFLRSSSGRLELPTQEKSFDRMGEGTVRVTTAIGFVSVDSDHLVVSSFVTQIGSPFVDDASSAIVNHMSALRSSLHEPGQLYQSTMSGVCISKS